MQSTSGTTGRRVVAFYTQHDLDLWEDCCARAIVAAGGTKEDVVHVSYGYGLFTGGFGLNGGSHKLGSLTLPILPAGFLFIQTDTGQWRVDKDRVTDRITVARPPFFIAE